MGRRHAANSMNSTAWLIALLVNLPECHPSPRSIGGYRADDLADGLTAHPASRLQSRP